MKNLFVCAAMLACCALSHAQKKTPLSFRDYLNNNSRVQLYKPQVYVAPGINYNKLPGGKKINPDDSQRFLTQEKQSEFSTLGKYAGVLPNGNKLYLLPMDNMPCVVPDLSQFNMPVDRSNNHLDEKITR